MKFIKLFDSKDNNTISYFKLKDTLEECFIDLIDEDWNLGYIKNPKMIYDISTTLGQKVITVPLYKRMGGYRRHESAISPDEYIKIINMVNGCSVITGKAVHFKVPAE